ncbi:hypothetical protein CBS101457_003974 [Exobasidium rhododendri]|nr:hypothetical protein CBS101457_003974 [Exobasidium rhododendri]
MGSSSSKPARKLGQQVSSAHLQQGSASRPAGSRQALPVQETGPQAPRFAPPPAQQSPQRFSESKTQDVRNDGQDPQLLARLQEIGQVKVPRNKVTFQQSNPMLNILAARHKNTMKEEEANTSAQLSSQGLSNAGAIKNRLNAQSIIALLDERKECKSRRQVEELAVAYDVDINIVDQLARWVNSPSVESDSGRQRQPVNVDSDDDLPDRINAVWTEPALADVREIAGKV